MQFHRVVYAPNAPSAERECGNQDVRFQQRADDIHKSYQRAFRVRTNAAGAIDNWGIDMVAQIGNGEIAEIFSGPGGDQRVFGGPDGLPDNGFKFFGAADIFASGVWTVSTMGTNVPEPASGTLLIAGIVGLAGLSLKKSL